MANIIQSTTIPVLEQAIAFSQARHTLLAGNIANLDTPGYVARDLSVSDFQTRLKEAIQASRESPGGQSSADSDPVGLGEVSRGSQSILLHDQSQVGAEYQVNEMVKNHMQHNMAVTLLTHEFQLLRAAISEQA